MAVPFFFAFYYFGCRSLYSPTTSAMHGQAFFGSRS